MQTKTTHLRQLRPGYGYSKGHHGEVVQGVFESGSYLERALVTLPCPRYTSTAAFFPEYRQGIAVSPAAKTKAKRAAELVLSRYVVEPVGGQLVLYSDVPEKQGCGSSTLDTTASIKAVADAIGLALSYKEVVKLAIEVETASDPLHFPSATLFAQRKGEVIEDYQATLPVFHVIGFSTDRNGTDTLAMELPRYTAEEIDAFAKLRAQIRRGVSEASHALIADAATQSARINQRYQPKPFLEEIIAIVLGNGGLGIQISHSGSVVGCLFAAGSCLPAMSERIFTQMSVFGFNHFYEFTTA